ECGLICRAARGRLRSSRPMEVVMRAIAILAFGVLAAAMPAIADDAGAQPGDDALTCQEIAVQMMPYVQQIRGNVGTLGPDAQGMARRSAARGAQAQADGAAEAAEMEGPCAVGINATCAAASEAMQARHDARNRQIAAEDKPITDRMSHDMQNLAATGQAM